MKGIDSMMPVVRKMGVNAYPAPFVDESISGYTIYGYAPLGTEEDEDGWTIEIIHEVGGVKTTRLFKQRWSKRQELLFGEGDFLIELVDGTIVKKENYNVLTAKQIGTDYPTVKRILRAGKLDSSITSLNSAFRNLPYLEYANLTTWDISNVTDLEALFMTSGLKGYNLNGWNVKSITSMRSIFMQCANIKEIDCSIFMGAPTITLYDTFNGCSSVEELDLSMLDVSAVLTLRQLFKDCTSLKTLNLTGWNTSSLNYNDYYTTAQTFSNCVSLEQIIGWVPGTMKCTLDLSSCPLNFESVLVMLNACSDEPKSGAMMTFKSGLYNNFTEEEKNQIDSIRNAKTNAGWTIINMGN